jgi:hypothetical protein
MAGSEQLALVAALQTSLEHDDAPPTGTDGPLEALWHVGKGNYERAQALLEPDFSKEAAWVRAHLHRRRGEDAEAADWYGKAGRNPSTDPVDKEWNQIAAGVLLNV